MAQVEFDAALIERYAGPEMAGIFSPRSRHGTWRDLWIALARAERELGLPIEESQIAELEAKREEFDFARVAELEAELRHDVMAHVHAWGEVCPTARPIIRLSASSCVSPGPPRKPRPPRCLSKCVHVRTRRERS